MIIGEFVMKRQGRPKKQHEKKEAVFQSLIFPMKRMWVVKASRARTGRSIVKRILGAFNARRADYI